MPVIVGAPRSGTTLLRLMLDTNPALAIGPETGFVPEFASWGAILDARQQTYSVTTNLPTWPDFGIEKHDFKSALAELGPAGVTECLRCFYRLYSSKFGKLRYGDKTPGYALHLLSIEALLPEAHFIHLIRDGRDVAVSLRDMWFSPGPDIRTQAGHWAKYVTAARRAGGTCKHYLEVRYEDLILDTEKVLHRICEYLRLTYDPCMLDYHLRAGERLQEHQGRTFADGRVLTREQRLRQQTRATLPLQTTLVGGWKTQLTEEEQRMFSQTAGELLSELGYS